MILELLTAVAVWCGGDAERVKCKQDIVACLISKAAIDEKYLIKDPVKVHDCFKNGR